MSSLWCREEWYHPQALQKLDKTIGTSRSPWEILELLVDLFRTAGLFPEPADSPRVMYPWFCFQTVSTFSRLHTWCRKSWHMKQWNIALSTNYLTVPSSLEKHQITNFTEILLVPASASLPCPKHQLPDNSHRMYLPDEKPVSLWAWFRLLLPGDTLTVQSGRFPAVHSSPHEDQA